MNVASELVIIRTKHYSEADTEDDVIGLYPMVHRVRYRGRAYCNNTIKADDITRWLVRRRMIEPLIRAGILRRCKRCWPR